MGGVSAGSGRWPLGAESRPEPGHPSRHEPQKVRSTAAVRASAGAVHVQDPRAGRQRDFHDAGGLTPAELRSSQATTASAPAPRPPRDARVPGDLIAR